VLLPSAPLPFLALTKAISIDVCLCGSQQESQVEIDVSNKLQQIA